MPASDSRLATEGEADYQGSMSLLQSIRELPEWESFRKQKPSKGGSHLSLCTGDRGSPKIYNLASIPERPGRQEIHLKPNRNNGIPDRQELVLAFRAENAAEPLERALA